MLVLTCLNLTCFVHTHTNILGLWMQWEKVKKAGIVPSPRTNFGLVTHKKRAILFGGITDQHGRGDRMYSSMHDELFQMNLETHRWYPVAVKAPAKAAKASSKAAAGKNTKVGGTVGPDTDAVPQAGGSADPGPEQATTQGLSTGPDQATGSTRDSDNVPAAAAAAPDHSASAKAGKASQEGSGRRGQADEAAGVREADGSVQPDLASKLSDAGVDKNSALYKAAARIQSRFRGYTVRKVSACCACCACCACWHVVSKVVHRYCAVTCICFVLYCCG